MSGLRSTAQALGDSIPDGAESAHDGAGGEDSPGGGDAVQAARLDLPEGLELGAVTIVQMQRAPEGTPFKVDEGACSESSTSPRNEARGAPASAVPAWQDSRYDNDQVMVAVAEWAARVDPGGDWSAAEMAEYDAMWRPASPQASARLAALPPDEPPSELIAAYDAYRAWLAANPEASVDERVAVKAALFAGREEWQ